jgi:hypothetical protein
VFLNDSFQDIGRSRVIPHALRVNYGDWAAFADAKTVGLGAEDTVEDA